MIYFTADWHFNHNRDFIYKFRGFESVWDMNEAIVERHNKIVEPDDIIYCLGDLCLGGGSFENLKQCKKMISSMKGHFKIILGNHDTPTRIQMYSECWNIDSILGFADIIKYNNYHFYLSHYPTMTANLDDDKPLKARTLNLYGHTHQGTNFYFDYPYNYHVGVDSHNCKPVSIDTVIEDMKEYYNTFLHIPS